MKLMRNENVCPNCGQERLLSPSVVTISVSSPSSPEILCARCAAEQHAATLQSVEEADRLIADVTEKLETLEGMIAMSPQIPTVPSGLESLAMTPMNIYRMLQDHVTAFKVRRLELMTSMESDERLQIELKKAIDAEDYKLAAEIKRKLDASA